MHSHDYLFGVELTAIAENPFGLFQCLIIRNISVDLRLIQTLSNTKQPSPLWCLTTYSLGAEGKEKVCNPENWNNIQLMKFMCILLSHGDVVIGDFQFISVTHSILTTDSAKSKCIGLEVARALSKKESRK